MAKKIYCLAECAYQADGVTDLLGGGEIWLENFVDLLKKLNYEVKLFQFSNEPFAKKWRGHWIVGLGNITNSFNRNDCYIKGFEKFHNEAKDADGIFYLSMNLSNGLVKDIPVLTVSHGIMLDRCEKEPNMNHINNLDVLKKWIRSASHTISVDTNTIKINAVYWPENVSKMTYIPNYYDEKLFHPIKKEDKSKFTVLFPRRVDIARGYRTALASAEILLQKYDDIEFLFVGKGNKAEEQEFAEWQNKLGNRVKHYSLLHEKMPEAYKLADISIVPTWYSEGTSIACIESMGMGVPVVVTTVGGLTDLIISSVNGLMIPPKNIEELVNAIEYLYLNRDEVQRMKENCLRIAPAFSKTIWESKVTKVVKQVFGEP
jgi:glycosyltransferase involved in cell wall biosynthesis